MLILSGSNGSNLIITATNALTIEVTNAATTATQLGIISSSGSGGSLIKSGDGTLILAAGNTYVGDTAVLSGTLVRGANGGIPSTPTSTLTIYGGTFSMGTVINNLTTQVLTLKSGQITSPTSYFLITPSALLQAGSISARLNWGLMTKSTSGTVTLSGANAGTGDIQLLEGTLALGNNAALGTGLIKTMVGGSSSAALEASGGARSIANAMSVAESFTISGSQALTLSGGIALQTARSNYEVAVINTATTTFSGVISESSGARGLTKSGAGLLVLSGANTYTGGTILNAGTLGIGGNSALGSGALTINGGGLEASGAAHTVTNAITLNGDTTFSGSNYLELAGAVTLTGNRELTVTNTAITSLAGVIGESGGARSLTKSGAGELMLGGINTYTGGTVLNAGTLSISNDFALGSGALTINGGALQASGALYFNPPSFLPNALTLNGDTTFSGNNHLFLLGAVTLTGNRELTVTNSAITGFAGVIGESGGARSLTKSGAGELVLGGASTYSGGTILTEGALGIGHDAALGTGLVRLDGGVLQASGGARSLANAITLNDDSTIAGSEALTLNGAFTLARTRELTITNTARTTIAGAIGESGGSRILMKYGSGLLELTGANTYTGGTFIGEGTVRINNSTGSAFGTGAVTVASGATLSGTGSFTGALQLNGIFSPGNSPGQTNTGSQTWAGGAGYLWEINDATSPATGAGTRYDLLAITGTLTIAATAGDKFTLSLVSLLANNTAGDVVNFNSAVNSSYTIASASGGIIGFSADEFTIDQSGFTNANTHNWSLTQNGNNLVLNYSAIPEPSTYALALASVALLVVIYRRRQLVGQATRN